MTRNALGLSHPYERWPARNRGRWFLALIGVFILTEAALQYFSLKLKTEQAPYGIASYQLAGTVEKSTEVINSWDDDVRSSAKWNLLFDYPFLLAYSTLFAATCVWATGLHSRVQRIWAMNLGLLLAWGQWVAATFDAIENIALLKMLETGVQRPWPRIAQVSAVIKYFLVIGALAYMLFFGAIYWILLRITGRRSCAV